METRRLLVMMVLAAGLMFLWMWGVQTLGERMNWTVVPPQEAGLEDPADPDPATEALTLPDPPAADPATRPAVPDTATDSGTDAATTRPTDVPAPTRGAVVADTPDATPAEVVLGSVDPHGEFSMQLRLTNLGAGIREVLLNAHDAQLRDVRPFTFEATDGARPGEPASLAIRRIVLDGQIVELQNVPWRVVEQTDRQVTFAADVVDADGSPEVQVVQNLRLFTRDEGAQDGQPDLREGYEVLLRQSVRNLTDRPVEVRLVTAGPAVPPRELEYGADQNLIAGFRGRNGTVRYEAHDVGRFDTSRQPMSLRKENDDPPLMWAGTSSIYFAAIVRPISSRPVQGVDVPPAEWLSDVVARPVNPRADRQARRAALDFVTVPQTLAPGTEADFRYRVFFGPKRRDLLTNAYFSAPGRGFQETLVSPFGCTWCVFGPVVNVLVWLLTAFYTVTRDWGLAIICLVILVRLLLHPITRKSQMSMMKFAKLGPEIQKIKEKYGDDKQKMAEAMGEFYRQHGVASLPLGCLPMFLQMPIWIALYSTLQAEFRLRHAPFLYGWTWIDDLARPDHLIEFARSYQFLILPPIGGVNLLPVLLAVVFFIQFKIQPQPAAMTPEQRQQQKIIMWMMTLMFPIFLYSAPSGLNLYILTSTLIGIFESKRIRAQVKAKEEAEAAAAPTLVPDKPTRASKEKKRSGGKPEPAAPRTGIAGWLANVQENLQKRVEDAQREAAKRSTQRGKR